MDYNKLLNKARTMYAECVTNAEKRRLESIFPELTEGEDEKIRKEILSIVKSYRENCITEGNHRFDDCIALLEKQGKESDYNPYKTTIESIYAMVEKYANGDLRNFYDNIKAKCKDAMEYDNTWLEKQGDYNRLVEEMKGE